MLERLHADVRVLAREPGASTEDIALLEAKYPELPLEFIELMREATEVELSYRGRYLRLYGPSGCLQMDEAYSISRRIPQAITIGDNGGGQALVFLPERGIYRVGYGALDPSELVFLAAGLQDLLVDASVLPDAVGGCEA